ncbi:hypothetical protein CsSME_00004748 [Camellia sinensis var. sinensis]
MECILLFGNCLYWDMTYGLKLNPAIHASHDTSCSTDCAFILVNCWQRLKGWPNRQYALLPSGLFWFKSRYGA